MIHGDSRGGFFEWFTESGFQAMAGHRFDLRQANCSTSSAGVLRGLHFAQLPPSQAKYVTCVSGAVFDVVVDIRVGSPTFGQWDAVLLDDVAHRATYISEGLAHGFLALQDDSTVVYLCSTPYAPDREHTIAATDPAIGIEWPLPAAELVLSVPQKHKVTVDPLGEIGTFKHLPPTLMVQYHFTDLGAFKPYVGAGVNYTKIWGENMTALGQPVTLDGSSVGLALQVGVDYKLNRNWYLNADVKKVQIKSDVMLGGNKISEVKLDPWLVSIGVGYRF